MPSDGRTAWGHGGARAADGGGGGGEGQFEFVKARSTSNHHQHGGKEVSGGAANYGLGSVMFDCRFA